MDASMEPFGLRCKKIAEKETRTILVYKEQHGLPKGRYTFLESYCNDPNCDCRRVFLNVVCNDKVIATIGYGWESIGFYRKWFGGGNSKTNTKIVKDIKGPILELTGHHTSLSKSVLELFKKVLVRDAAYVQRLQVHYVLFKSKLMEDAGSTSSTAKVEDGTNEPEYEKKLSEMLLPDKKPASNLTSDRYSRIYLAIESMILDSWEHDRSLTDADVLRTFVELSGNLDSFDKGSLTELVSYSIKYMLSTLKDEENLQYTKGELRSCLSYLIGIMHNHKSPREDGYLRWIRNFFRGKLPQTEEETFKYISDNESEFAKPLEDLGWKEISGGRMMPTIDVFGGQPKIRIGRNDPCPCGSGQKYKKCCLGKTGS